MIEFLASGDYLLPMLAALGGELLVAVWLLRLCRRLRVRPMQQRALSTSQIRNLRASSVSFPSSPGNGPQPACVTVPRVTVLAAVRDQTSATSESDEPPMPAWDPRLAREPGRTPSLAADTPDRRGSKSGGPGEPGGNARGRGHTLSPAAGTPAGTGPRWWRECGCGCEIWHRCLDGDTLVCPHPAVDLSADAVLWVIDPAKRCQDCLVMDDEVVTARAHRGLTAAQSTVVDSLDTVVRLIGQSIDTDAQISDMIAEGGPVWAGQP